MGGFHFRCHLFSANLYELFYYLCLSSGRSSWSAWLQILLFVSDPAAVLEHALELQKRAHKAQDLEIENKKLRETLDEYNHEFAEVKNQGEYNMTQYTHRLHPHILHIHTYTYTYIHTYIYTHTHMCVHTNRYYPLHSVTDSHTYQYSQVTYSFTYLLTLSLTYLY